MSEFVDYYEILQVHRSADPDVIEAAYKKLIFRHHPDRGGNEATAKRITGAFYVLKDPARRREYDRAFSQQTTHSVAPTSDYVGLEDIPPAVIDAILAATLAEMAAATVRTAGRAVVAAGAAAWNAAEEAAAKSARKKETKAAIERDAFEQWFDGIGWRVQRDLLSKQLSLSSDAKAWLVSCVMSEEADFTAQDFPLRYVSPEDATALLRQGTSPYATHVTRMKVIGNPKYATTGYCDKCDRRVRWKGRYECARCSAPVSRWSVVEPTSAEAIEAAYEPPESALEKYTRLVIMLVILGLVVWWMSQNVA